MSLTNLSAFLMFISVIFVYYFFTNAAKIYVVRFTLIFWLAIYGVLANTGFFNDSNSMPPKMILAILPALVLIIILFTTQFGKNFIDKLDFRLLLGIHIVRIPIEIMLHNLYEAQLVPKMLTYEGANFDIISGITGFALFFTIVRGIKINPKILLIWNILALGLLLNVVIRGILSVPSAVQMLNFNMPNKAMMYFPYIWLPSFIVPMVLFSHLVIFRKLLKKDL